MSGYVYVASNPMVNGVKIGMTERTPDERLNELSGSTSVPGKFNLEFSIESDDPHSLEKNAHEALDDDRIHGSEFFNCSVSKAREIINNCKKDENMPQRRSEEIWKDRSEMADYLGVTERTVTRMVSRGELLRREAEDRRGMEYKDPYNKSFTIDEMAEHLGVSKRTVFNRVNRGEVEKKKTEEGTRYRVAPTEKSEWHTAEALADKLNISQRSLYRWLKRGDLEKRETDDGTRYRVAATPDLPESGLPDVGLGETRKRRVFYIDEKIDKMLTMYCDLLDEDQSDLVSEVLFDFLGNLNTMRS